MCSPSSWLKGPAAYIHIVNSTQVVRTQAHTLLAPLLVHLSTDVQCWVAATLRWSLLASLSALAAMCTWCSGRPYPSGALMRR